MMLPRALLTALLFLQNDPLAAAKKDLGGGFDGEVVEPGVLLAWPAPDGENRPLLDSMRRAVRTFRSRALDVPPRNSLLIIRFGTQEGYRRFTAERYPGPVPQAGYYDVPNSRVLLGPAAAEAYARQVARIFLLADSLNGGTLPAWLAAGLPHLEDPDPEPATFDHRAALLQESLRHDGLPPLRRFLAMDLSTFHEGEWLSLHTSLSLKFCDFLEKKGALKKFFQEYRRSFRKDDTGGLAVEAALGQSLERIDTSFREHLRDLPWLNQDRFLSQARQVFGPNPLLRVDEGLRLAVTGNVEPKVAADALDELHRLHDPLVRLFNLRSSGLPVLARLFKDQEAFQAYAKIDAPHRQWIGGYFSFDSRWLVLHLEPDSGSLTHEYCHSLFEDDLGRLPPWLTEGLACLFEHFNLEGGVPRGEPGSAVTEARLALAQNRMPKISELANMRGVDFFDPERVNLNYDLSHALLCFLQERRVLVPMYADIQSVKRAKPFALPVATCRGALEKALGGDLARGDQDFRVWLLAQKR